MLYEHPSFSAWWKTNWSEWLFRCMIHKLKMRCRLCCRESKGPLELKLINVEHIAITAKKTEERRCQRWNIKLLNWYKQRKEKYCQCKETRFLWPFSLTCGTVCCKPVSKFVIYMYRSLLIQDNRVRGYIKTLSHQQSHTEPLTLHTHADTWILHNSAIDCLDLPLAIKKA